jgi:hypothetical protein
MIEDRDGATRYIFSNVGMRILPIRNAGFGLTGLLSAGLMFLVIFGFATTPVGILIAIAIILIIGLASATRPVAGKAVVTVSDYGVTLQLGSRAFNSPIRVPRQDILRVMLAPIPLTAILKMTNPSALPELGTVILQRRSAAPLVLISGCPRSDLQPLVANIMERFKISPDCTAPADHQTRTSEEFGTLSGARSATISPVTSGITARLNVNAASPSEFKHSLEQMDYPLNLSDRRITMADTGEVLAIKIRRTSTFWQPVTLLAIGLILPPILGFSVFLGIWGLHAALASPSGSFWHGQTGTYLFLLFVSLAILVTIIMAAIKSTTIVADREKLAVQTSWGLLKRRIAYPAMEIVSFGVGEKLIRSQYGAIVSRYLYVEQKSGSTNTLLATVRLPEQQLGRIATTLRNFYKL